MSGKRILAVDDDPSIREMVRDYLVDNDFQVETAASGAEMNQILETKGADLILLDVKLPDMDGLDALPKCRELAPETPIIVMTAHGTRQIAMEAITRGAYDFFTKPLKMAEFQVVVARALDRRRLQQQVKVLRAGQPMGFE